MNSDYGFTLIVDNMTEKALTKLQHDINYAFKDIELLKLALTHSSWVNEQDNQDAHNERLEFLGDAILEIHISRKLFEHFPHAREGLLTRLRSSMVNSSSLAKIAKQLELGLALRMGKGEESQGGRTRPSLLADTLEAMLGAIFLDSDFDTSGAVIYELFVNAWPQEETHSAQKKDYKTKLQEYTQAQFKYTPKYEPLSHAGPEHAKTFHVALLLPNNVKITGEGKNIKKAEQEAARKGLEYLIQKQE